MWALIVAVSLMLAGALLEDKMTYTAAAWRTEQECKDFVASEAGQESLKGLRAYLVASADAGSEVKIDPVCTQIEGSQ
jgi:hypothetical protein